MCLTPKKRAQQVEGASLVRVHCVESSVENTKSNPPSDSFAKHQPRVPTEAATWTGSDYKLWLQRQQATEKRTK